MANALIYFKDNGQDFLRWTVDESGTVVDSHPFQADVWKGLKVTNLAKLKPGGIVEYSHHGRHGCISHLVTSIIPLAPVEVTVRNDSFGYVTSSVRGKKVSCTHSAEYAVRNLAKKIFTEQNSTIEQMEFTATGRLHSKWLVIPEGV